MGCGLVRQGLQVNHQIGSDFFKGRQPLFIASVLFQQLFCLLLHGAVPLQLGVHMALEIIVVYDIVQLI